MRGSSSTNRIFDTVRGFMLLALNWFTSALVNSIGILPSGTTPLNTDAPVGEKADSQGSNWTKLHHLSGRRNHFSQRVLRKPQQPLAFQNRFDFNSFCDE